VFFKNSIELAFEMFSTKKSTPIKKLEGIQLAISLGRKVVDENIYKYVSLSFPWISIFH
jgi:hypothetical protein